MDRFIQKGWFILFGLALSMEILEEELHICHQLLELEPDSKCRPVEFNEIT